MKYGPGGLPQGREIAEDSGSELADPVVAQVQRSQFEEIPKRKFCNVPKLVVLEIEVLHDGAS
jgi:hypothetical protein